MNDTVLDVPVSELAVAPVCAEPAVALLISELAADTPVRYVPGAGYIIGRPEPVAWAQFWSMLVAHEEESNA